MKKVFILIICICFSELILAQKYYPFPTSNAVWRENHVAVYGSSNSSYFSYQNFISGDTLIMGKTYHKIYKTGYVNHKTRDTNIYSEYKNEYVGAIREDNSKRIYFFKDIILNEQLLYDFNLKIGDKLPTMVGTREDIINNHVVYTVHGIDSVIVSGVFHKRFEIFYSTNSKVYLIEGLGSTDGLLARFYPSYGYNFELICFQQDGKSAFPDGVECNLISTGISEVNLQNEIQIFPNPSTGIINISNLPDRPLKLQLFNMLGKLVYETQIQAINYSLNLNLMPGGIYLLKVIEKNKSIVFEKVILQ